MKVIVYATMALLALTLLSITGLTVTPQLSKQSTPTTPTTSSFPKPTQLPQELPPIRPLTFSVLKSVSGTTLDPVQFPESDTVAKLIKDAEQMTTIWHSLYPSQKPVYDYVDFTQSDVLLIVLDRKPTNGYQVAINTIVAQDHSTLNIAVVETRPKTGCPANDVLTRPGLLVVLPKTTAVSANVIKTIQSSDTCL